MLNKIYMHLQVSDLEVASDFYTKLGFSIIDMYTTGKSKVLRVSDRIFLMLYKNGSFDHHALIPGVELSNFKNMSMTLAAESIAEIDTFVEKAKKAGATVYPKAVDNGMMYSHGFKDPDGNVWDLFVFYK